MVEVSAQQTGTSPGKIWLKSYPPGIAAEIGPLPYKSIGEFFDHAVARYSTRPAFTCMGKTLSFADLNAESAKIGAWLQSLGSLMTQPSPGFRCPPERQQSRL